VKSIKFMLLTTAVLCGWLTIVGSAFAQTWTQTSAPTLNLTNLQDEVVLSPTNNGGFYRLESFLNQFWRA
jgi:hypothetical protein